MKTPFILLAVFTVLLNVAHAEITKDQLDKAMKSAERKYQMLVFFFEQELDPADPKSRPEVELVNRTLRKAASSRHVNLMVVKAGDAKSIENLPECVKTARKGGTGQLILTDNQCTSVAGTLEGKFDDAQAKAFKQQIEDGLKKQRPQMIGGGVMPRNVVPRR